MYIVTFYLLFISYHEPTSPPEVMTSYQAGRFHTRSECMAEGALVKPEPGADKHTTYWNCVKIELPQS